MKYSEFMKLTPQQISIIEKNEWDDLEQIGFSDEQWGLLTNILSSYKGDSTVPFKDWILSEMEDAQNTLYKGAWIIDKKYGEIGTVSNVFEDGVTARFGNRVAIKTFQEVELAPMDIREEDYASLIDLALATNDREWFTSLTKRMNEERVAEW